MATCNYDTSSTWADWNTSATCASGGNTIWTYWTSTTSGTASTTVGYVWHEWSDNVPSDSYITLTTTVLHSPVWTSWENQVQESREQKRAREAQEVINAAKVKDIQDAKTEAEITAQKLLEDLITPDEMAIYKKTGHLLVKGNRFDYLLQKNYQASVIKLEKGKLLELSGFKGKLKGRSLCVHPENQHVIPDTDKIISMKLALEFEEDRMLKTANDHGERQLDLVVNQ
jgi:hypothetical protein